MKNKYENVIKNLNKDKPILILGSDNEIESCISYIKNNKNEDKFVFDKNCKEITSVIVIKSLFGKIFYKIIYNKLFDIYVIRDISFVEKFNGTMLEQEAVMDMLEELYLLNKTVILTGDFDIKYLNIIDNKLREYINKMYVIKI